MIVYKLTNKINGKSYVGQTIQRIEDRMMAHKHNKSTYIGKAIQKYGFENFGLEILAKAETADQLNLLEIELIKENSTLFPNGYNHALGGAASGGQIPSGLSKKRISETLKKKGIRPPSRSGIPSSDKQKESARNIPNSLRWPSSRSRISKKRIKVRCVDTGDIFSSITEASTVLKIPIGNISKVLKGERPSAGGRKFERYNG